MKENDLIILYENLPGIRVLQELTPMSKASTAFVRRGGIESREAASRAIEGLRTRKRILLTKLNQTKDPATRAELQSQILQVNRNLNTQVAKS